MELSDHEKWMIINALRMAEAVWTSDAEWMAGDGRERLSEQFKRQCEEALELRLKLGDEE